MADWKVKGIVPDSEDEDDFDLELDLDLDVNFHTDLDNQILTRNDGLRNEKPSNETHDLEETYKDHNLGLGEPSTSCGGKTIEDKAQLFASQAPSSVTPVKESSSYDVGNLVVFPALSPFSPQVLKVLKIAPALEDKFGITNFTVSPCNIEPSNSPAKEIHTEDEISRSYVRITSPSASPLSSVPRSPSPGREGEHRSSSPLSAKQHSRRDPMIASTALIAVEDSPYMAKRSFRQRNAIQLHPYMIEQEKYRQTLKSRGMKPMRIAHTADEESQGRTQDASSPNPESQDTAIDGGESEPMDLDLDIPSSPPEMAINDGQANNDQRNDLTPGFDASGDDEFPDINQLLKMPPPKPIRSKTKRLKKYYSKHKRPKLSPFKINQPRIFHQGVRMSREFNILASPPATSSPLTAASFKSISRAMSNASNEGIPILPSIQDVDQIDDPTSLPTPLTSAIKAASGLIFPDKDTDSDDPLATQLNISSSQESSSDESVQIRKVVKKIRGVLPASHLRLDQSRKTARPQSPARGYSAPASPRRQQVQRGVAIPKTSTITTTTKSSEPANRGIDFLFNNSSDSEIESFSAGLVAQDNSDHELELLFNRQGSAEEEDGIDAMMPTGKRRSRGQGTQLGKRRRIGSKSASTPAQQTKITEHLKGRQQHQGGLVKSVKKRHSSSGMVRRNRSNNTKTIAPRLSILDVTNLNGDNIKHAPQFVRIAARTARSKTGQGKQSPSRKAIKLANRDDTLEVQGILQDWRQGKIQPIVKTYQDLSPITQTTRQPFQRISNNWRTKFLSPVSSTQISVSNFSGDMQKTQRVYTSTQQSSANDFFTPKDRRLHDMNNILPKVRKLKQSYAGPSKPRQPFHAARPAQLEAPELENISRNPNSAFKKTKFSLDKLYKASRRRGKGDLQLNRFLTDHSVNATIEVLENTSESSPNAPVLSKQITGNKLKRKSAHPNRIDVDATKFRQPSEPLVLESLRQAEAQSEMNQADKLQGLGKFGTKYPLSFDIHPLHSGVYFHESTFVGSGRLSKALQGGQFSSDACKWTSLRLGSKDFHWNLWDETVSSEIGMCLDEVADQLFAQQLPTSSTSAEDPRAVIIFIVDYIQYRLTFSDDQSRDSYLIRMSGIFRDFLGRLNVAGQQSRARTVEVLAMCIVILFHVLQMARKTPSHASLCHELEDIMKDFATNLISLLLSDGLENIRKLYDDLQYLSFREAGIKGDRYAMQAWVIVTKTLGAARILRGSFWDVVAPIMIHDISRISDARIFEKIWFSVFTLLPLCEFDDFGIIKPGQRHNASFDGWACPQKIVKRIFELYVSNQRQPAGFNDYCRISLARCHYLMNNWGWWKCSGIIGTIFDFFASQKLSHLRNEEVYDSPRFLKELDQQQHLTVEPEDRSFHIFLKMVGVGIKHLELCQDIKGVRNMVARLLPNHNRQYPKEEAIHYRELASLRNHHDLLCTLYWAAPPEHRPSPSLIQDLVIAEHSHNEACLINLRAWENLTRFIVATSNNTTAYKPFTIWQNGFAASLSKQFIEADSEVRVQADSFSGTGTEPFTERFLQDTVASNKKSTMEMLRAMVKVMDHTVLAATSAQMAILAFNPNILSTVCSSDLSSDSTFPEGMFMDCIDVVNHYVQKIDHLEPIGPSLDQTESTAECDSQGSLDMNFDRVEMIYRLQPEIIPLVQSILSRVLQDRSKISPTLVFEVVLSWARMVVKVTEGSMHLKDFLANGFNAVFDKYRESKKKSHYWPVFLSEVVQHKTLDNLKMPGFDIGVEWMVALTMPQSDNPPVVDAVNTLTAVLRSQGYYLSTWPSSLTGTPSSSSMSNEARIFSSHVLIKSAIGVMRAIMLSQANINALLGNISMKDAQHMFSTTLKAVMVSIQHYLEAMSPGSDEHLAYVKFIQPIISIIRSHAGDFQPLLEFFVQPSNFYWPEDTDPQLYVAGIVSYSLRLTKNPGRASSELFHYLYNGFRNDLIHGQIERHMKYVKKGMNSWEFTLFLVSEFVPAAIRVGFQIIGGWVLCAAYLPAVSSQSIRLLQGKNYFEAASTFDHLINILKIISNELVAQCLANEQTGNPSACWEYILHVVTQFWLSLNFPMRHYAASSPEKEEKIEAIELVLSKSIYQASQLLNGEHDIDPLVIQPFEPSYGENTHTFTSSLTRDINDNWEINQAGNIINIQATRARNSTRIKVDISSILGKEPQTITQMLRLALPFLACAEEIEYKLGESSTVLDASNMFW